MGDEKNESFSEKVGAVIDEAHRDMREAAGSIGPALDQAGEDVSRVARGAAGAIGEGVGGAAGKAGEYASAALDRGYAELTRFGRMVLRLWKFFDRMNDPPWTVYKVLFWVSFFLLIAVITAVAYQIKYGVLTLPIIEQAGGQFVTWMASLGAPGLFFFTAVGTLFFMVIPTEPFFFVALAGVSPVVAIIAAALGSTVGSCANYWMGNRVRLSAGKGTGEERKLGKWGQRAHSKWGTLMLVAAGALPLPEIVALAYGLADYPFKKFVLVTLAARFVKWTWVAAAFLLVTGAL